jgi:hypothetical protein
MVVAQLREVPSAERSRKTAQEDQHDGSIPQEIVEYDVVSVVVGKHETGCSGSNRCGRAVCGH